MDQTRLRATNNYVYSVSEDLIGKGATCEVYRGIHKESGQIHALKIFERRLKVVAEREIEALRSLKHENIVEFIGQETDKDTGRVVAVMEYCDKSLYSALCEPEHRSGLSESEFIRFFKHTVEGMKHLRQHDFLHRDIKPGNILVSQDDDGSYVYKLTDFGTAKPVLETEAFQSLVGTEEYLHPNIFKAAFIEPGKARQFDAAADLWSLGATLYHAATGRVPFQPHQGRSNKLVMFEMIAKKPFGVIGVEQKSDGGDLIWITELPNQRYSRWLRDALTDILKRLMEGDPTKAMTFDAFFNAADDILSRHIVFFFSTTSARHFRLYMQQDSVFADIQHEVKVETNIPPKDQLIHYEGCLLRDVVGEMDPLCTYPKMSEETPLVMIRSTAVDQCVMPDEVKFWYNDPLFENIPSFYQSTNMEYDLRVAKTICDSIALVQSHVQLACLTQQLFEKIIGRTERWKEILVSRLQTEVELYRYRVKDLVHIHSAIARAGVMPNPGVSIDDIKSRINSCSSFMKRIQEFASDNPIPTFTGGCADESKCQKKIGRFLEQAKDKKVVIDIKKRQRRALNFHEEKIHKFDKKQLSVLYNKAFKLWTEHCSLKVAEIHKHFLQWHRMFARLQTQIEMLQKEIKGTNSAIKKYTRQFQTGLEPGLSTNMSGTSLSSLDMDSQPPMSTLTAPYVSVVTSGQTRRKELTANLINR
ncbi:serine/threonine-protein kinase TBK1-like isoform X2 [Mya arenaria]|nr:serine/threonine-protein kinase TBK1-like isoform X2 [Mya arenaria]